MVDFCFPFSMLFGLVSYFCLDNIWVSFLFSVRVTFRLFKIGLFPFLGISNLVSFPKQEIRISIWENYQVNFWICVRVRISSFDFRKVLVISAYKRAIFRSIKKVFDVFFHIVSYSSCVLEETFPNLSRISLWRSTDLSNGLSITVCGVFTIPRFLLR